MNSLSVRSISVPSLFFTIFFWIFNASLLLIVYLGFLPFLGITLLSDATAGEVPLNLLLPFLGLVGVPTTCSVVGLIPQQRRKLGRKRVSLFQLFYGVEAPLLLLCILRFFVLRDLTPSSAFLLLSGMVATLAFTHWLLGRKPELTTSETSEATWWHLAGQTLLLTLAGYMLAILAFWVLPALTSTFSYWVLIAIYALILLPLTILLLGITSMPLGMAVAALKAWIKSSRELAMRHGQTQVRAFSLLVVAIWLGLFLVLQQQPQVKALELLKTPPQSDAERQELLQQQGLIRKGLVNAYLAPYRYLRFKNDGQNVYDYYHKQVLLPEGLAQFLQSSYDLLMAPFTYNGSRTDQDQASGLYAQFFDQPIVRAELPTIQKAMRSTFNRGEAKASLLDINEKRVWLAEQQVTVTPKGDWAEVELHEVYRNQTSELEEILYYFSLPESAVVSGLWLGETADLNKRFTFQVATRGAAQQVYTQQVVRNQDPALLEQVGPRNYRLRAFPIPRQGNGEMHLWLTYKVLKQSNGWAMPELNERRNLFWTNRTRRFVNGERVNAQDQWLPASIAADSQAQPVAHQLTLPQGGHILAKPFAEQDYRLPQNQRFALVIDDSYSMNAHQKEVSQTMQWLKEQVLPQNQIDLYLTAAEPAQPQRQDIQSFDPAKATFYGTLQPKQMLQQFQQLRGNSAYDAVILLTDAGSYELSEDSQTALDMPAPLWMVHLGGLQPAYDDATLEAIQSSGGNTSTQIQEVMQRIGTQPSLGAGTSFLNLTDGYAWYLSRSADPTAQKDDAFAAIAARQWIAQVSQSIKPNQLQKLDAIHQLAERYKIVSPYSSMIVLVNQEQEEQLKQAEKAADRFKREVEDRQLPQPSQLGSDISAVPEPAEWLLIAVSLAGLGLVYWRRGIEGMRVEE